MKEAFKRFFERFDKLSKWQKAFAISISLMLTLVLGFVSLSLFGRPVKISSPVIKTFENDLIKEEAKVISNPLNGLLYTRTEAGNWQNRLPLAVVVENIVEVRPQSGLSHADIVYESLTEGGITRFLAVYLAEESEEIGPVRSVRPHFIDWSQELGALLAHIGGSPQALDKLIEYSVRTLPEERPFYFRKEDKKLGPEHTAFTSTKKLWEMADNRNYSGSPKIDSWKFKKEATSSARPASSVINLGFSGLKDYHVRWEYDADQNIYKRFGGDPGLVQLDKLTDQQINAKNLIVHYAGHSTPKDEKNRIDVQTLGEGEAKIFFDGTVIEATWKKESPISRTLYLDTNGKEIEFNRGKIWVEIVPIGSPVKYN